MPFTYVFFLFGDARCGGDDLSVSRQQRLPAPLSGEPLSAAAGSTYSNRSLCFDLKRTFRRNLSGVGLSGRHLTFRRIRTQAPSRSGDGAWQYLFRRGIPARNVSCPLSPRSCFHPRFQVSRLGIILPERLPIPHGRQWLCSFVRFTVTGIVRNSHPLPSMLLHRRISAENPVNIWIVV